MVSIDVSAKNERCTYTYFIFIGIIQNVQFAIVHVCIYCIRMLLLFIDSSTISI